MRHGVLAAALAAVASLVSTAGANGRPPVSNGVFFRPGDPHSVFVRSTFGLLVSHDDGCSFRWVCEQAIGYGGQFDPKYAIASDGTMFATTFTGLRVSRDGGCTWKTATAELPAGDPDRIAGIWVDAIEIAPNGDVWIATAESGKPNDVYRSTDNGVTFAPRNRSSPTVWWKSVKVAPTDARRVYVTGYQVAGPPLPDGGMQQPATHFLCSDDAGDEWTPSSLAGVAFGPTPLVLAAAVDPANADVVFITSIHANPPAGDRLYRSTDGGVTFAEVLATSAAINSVVYQGGKLYVATIAGGFVSTDNGATFGGLASTPQLGCLGSQSGQLIGCGANWEPDFKAVAKSVTDGATWDKVFRFVELAGPLQCAPGTPAHDMCDPMWPGLQQQFGAKGPTSCAVPPDMEAPPPKKPGGGCCDAGDGGAGGAIGALGLAAWLGLVSARRRCGAGSARPRPRRGLRRRRRAPRAR